MMLQSLTKSDNTLQPFLQRAFIVENGRSRGSVARLIAAFSLTICLTFAALDVPSQATVMQPWCSDPTGYTNAHNSTCMFSTYEQCWRTAGMCIANPSMDPLPQAPSWAFGGSPPVQRQAPNSRAARPVATAPRR
jgi:Protein of unknown function (DUF3551)